MKTIIYMITGIIIFICAVILGLFLFTIPAMVSLPSGTRPGIEELSLEEAAERLKNTGKESWDQIEEARILVGERMEFCRRNNYNHYRKAFRRGYGFCQQKAYALSELLQLLGYDARPVQALRNRFKEGISGHAWVEVTYLGERRYIDPQFQDPETGELLFEPITRVTGFTPLFRIFSGWGSAAVNAFVYYRTGNDRSVYG